MNEEVKLRDPMIRLFERADWMEFAVCKGMGTEVFFPTQGDSSNVALARTICQTCPVCEPCADYALRNIERFGIWGNTSERQRRQTRHKLRLKERTTNE